jgi:hypothetical protein
VTEAKMQRIAPSFDWAPCVRLESLEIPLVTMAEDGMAVRRGPSNIILQAQLIGAVLKHLRCVPVL